MFKFLYKNIFIIIALIYSNLSYLVEILFLKKNVNLNNNINKKGFEILKLKKPIKIKKTSKEKFKVNKYFHKIIIPNDEIKLLIYKFFIDNGAARKISKLTGFNYNITFLLAYNTYSIKDHDKDKLWHATIWHKDKPFSKNTLKVILPLKDIKKSHGGIEIVSKTVKSISKKTKFYKMVSNRDNFLIFQSNRCFHRAGNPKKDKMRSQIMFQLNPSNNWSFSENLYKKQKKLEPKFPFFYDLIVLKKKIRVKH